MKKFNWILLFLILSISSCKPTPSACFQNNCFELEIAQTPSERAKGLMFRESLDTNKGMLFVYKQEGIYPFWMKNTLIPLDIVWINQNQEVVYINTNTQPCISDPCPSYNPNTNALFVLEINAGVSDSIGLKPGDKLLFSNI